ncbi:S-locus glycoprotein [Corchorus olitorius]|uniref:non-specific serine/threonine protein kinase n=1 Tax=Corchorus olitorius TaxID=93759 RepID=A0A1R3J5L5_9ROSI|nr:S-locus glycoprotein [Corchorus olitorius]
MTPGQSLKDNETLVSAGGLFELGFFSPGSSKSRYVGIWYKKVSSGTVVWVANREAPLFDRSGVVIFNDQGIFTLMNSTRTVVWSSSTSTTVQNPVAQLLETGNLVVKDRNDDDNPENIILWQSFDYPCDNVLAGMKIGKNFITGFESYISSWKSSDDPAPGQYSWRIDPTGFPQLLVRKGTEIVYRAGSWNGLYFSRRKPNNKPNPVYSCQFVYNQNEVSYKCELLNSSVISRYAMNPSGLLQRFMWNERKQEWEIFATSQADQCAVYGLCGAYASCNPDSSTAPCSCLEGFVPKSPNSVDWSDGCVRRTPLVCDGEGDGFVKYTRLQLPDTSKSWANKTMSLKECEEMCLANCSCTAFANLDMVSATGCLLWFDELIDMTEFTADGQDLYIRLAKSEIGKHEEEMELPLFDFATISDSTDKFSSDNKLGQGGFGHVYKGILKEGKEIAVKRLSKDSGQGLDEFKNEVTFIAKLQHRNLVKLFGCCIKGDERMLIYEYLPNKSLDHFIFDKTRNKLLNWHKRMNIIDGIARGLLYLHHDSRLRIIHRDLKASNILLDNNMNPKILDFGLARKFGGDQTEDKTRRVVGTYGYMSPEYAFHGCFSMKSDVFSFGVLILEIITGKRSRGYSNNGYNLLGHAWRLWIEERPTELIDNALRDQSYIETEVLRCIHVALLCVQRRPEDRPNMSSVLLMLGGVSKLPQPKQPGYYIVENNLPSDEYPSGLTTGTSSSSALVDMEGIIRLFHVSALWGVRFGLRLSSTLQEKLNKKREADEIDKRLKPDLREKLNKRREADEIDKQLENVKERMEAMEKKVTLNTPHLFELEMLSSSPFSKKIDETLPPQGFKLPIMETYDGTSDPIDHLEMFKTNISIHGANNAIMCKAFPATLKKAARSWYSTLKPRSISSFRELGQQLASHFVSSIRHKKTFISLITLKQSEDEPLRDFVARFNGEALQTLPELLVRAKKYINAEETMAAKYQSEDKGKKKRDGDERERLSREKGQLSRGRSPPKSFEYYTPLKRLRREILMVLERENLVKWPKKMSSSGTKRDKSKCYAFHWDHGHETEGCVDLKNEIESFIRRGYLKGFVKDSHEERGFGGRTYGNKRNDYGRNNYRRNNERVENQREGRKPEDTERPIDNRPITGVINVITGGNLSGGASTSARKKHAKRLNIIASTEKRPMTWKDEPISFGPEDFEGIQTPHDDAIIISATVYNHTVRRILFDNGSASDVLYYDAMKKLGIPAKTFPSTFSWVWE